MLTLFMRCVLAGSILFVHGFTDDIGQQRIELPPLFNHTRRQNKPYIGDVGDGCFNSNDCRKRLCCVLLEDGASCQRRPNTGDQCSDFQVKGGRYDGHCPCLKKKDHCMNGVCVTKSRRRWLEE
uniref:Ixodegrin B n=1 Tax=Rhipicephalus zambeziensis TaxID=60191 RepID=A0A224YB07_9ACAR